MSGDDILVADIGGTNARFALARRDGAGFSLRRAQHLSAGDFPDFAAALASFLEANAARPSRACFAVAGPVRAGVAQLTNSSWRIARAAITAQFNIAHVRLVNDFAAQARGAPLTLADHVMEIAPGSGDASAPIVVLGPGTGLGLATLAPTPRGFRVLASEGGHQAYAPQTDLERTLAAKLQAKLGYVAFENVCSGIGLEACFPALCDIAGVPAQALSGAEIAARIDRDPVARMAFEIFFSALGVFAGNAVLATGARGGIFLGGGILPKMRAAFIASDFLARMRNRGPMSSYFDDVPVRLLLSDDVALIGAAALAEELETE